MLTGDKQETAINIGVSSRQISPDMNLIIINHKTLKVCFKLLQEPMGSTRQSCRLSLFQDVKDQLLREAESSSSKSNALVIDGKSLMYALDQSARELFLKVALKCKSVICCRYSNSRL